MKRGVANLVSLIYILLFIYAALSKLKDVDQFAAQLGQSPLLHSFSKLVVYLIPIMEIILALLLASSKFRLFSLYGCFTLMVIFTAYIYAIINFSEQIPCACGGILTQMNWHQHLWFNIAFVAIAIVAILLYPNEDFARNAGES